MADRKCKTYNPKIQVLLTKNVFRVNGVAKRASGQAAEIDLTPYLGDSGAVIVSKNIDAPMGGFTVALADQLDRDTLDTLYASIELADMITIRMAHAPHEYPQGLPIVMRGIVDRVHRDESIGQDGKPRRTINIVGNDYGLLFAQMQIFYAKAYWTGKQVLNTFRTYTTFESFEKPMAVSEFMRECVENIVNQHFAKLPFRIELDASVTEGTVVTHAVQPYEGPIWRMMNRQADKPWNELFVEDREDGAYLVFRPTPYKDIDGKWIPQGDQKVGAETVDVDAVDLVSIHIARDQTNITNFFWIAMPLAMFSTAPTAQWLQQGDPTVYIPDHANADPRLYGDRLMHMDSVLGFTWLKSNPQGQPRAEQERINSDYLTWMRERRRVLRDFNQDNALWESGTLTLRGDEHIKVGRYLRLRRGEMHPEYYVREVTHTYRPFRSFLTTVKVERGTGFIERTKLATSPYYAEGRPNAFGR